MNQVATITLLLVGLVWLASFSAFALVSGREGEKRAKNISFTIAILGAGAFFIISAIPASIQLIILGALGIAVLVGIFLFLLPIGRISMENDSPAMRFDERDIMFARVNLKPGSLEYESYYRMRPENKTIDDRTRAKPGLLSPHAQLANPHLFASPKGSFFLTESLHEAVNGPVAEECMALTSNQMTAYLKDLALYFGALDVGVTPLKPYHVYSHRGRGSRNYGAPIDIVHHYAIAFTVEMDFEMIGASPHAQTVMESARQYVESARVAVQLAATIRALGYPARAHIDGNYQVIAPLVARDAGLGEIGRIGLLMTPRHGPRVRLGVVTTDVDLVPTKRIPAPSVIDFCNICTKCAENCPSKSIPSGPRQQTDSTLRWQIDSETCFHYWNVIGTDCARCMAVCPYSHPNTFSHNLIRWGNERSGAFRRMANGLENLFYGKRPQSRNAPQWTSIP